MKILKIFVKLLMLASKGIWRIMDGLMYDPLQAYKDQNYDQFKKYYEELLRRPRF
jgi:hypothetical protein